MGLHLQQTHLHYSKTEPQEPVHAGVPLRCILPGVEFLRQCSFQDDLVGSGCLIEAGDRSAPGIRVVEQLVEFFT